MRLAIHSHKQMSEYFLTAALLSVSGGLQDVYTYIARGGVFANAQTGNIILLSQGLCTQNWLAVLRYFVPILFFALGIAVAEEIRQSCRNAQRLHWRQLVLLIEILLLFCVGFLPEKWNLLANTMVSFACAMQVQSFRKVHGYVFASTMCIGNIRSAMESLCIYHRTHDKTVRNKVLLYLSLISLFALGAALGGRLIERLGMRTIWISCLLLFISFSLMFLREDLQTKSDANAPACVKPHGRS